jgi:hypothetical protein
MGDEQHTLAVPKTRFDSKRAGSAIIVKSTAPNSVRRLPPGAWINRYQDEQKHHRDDRERNKHDHY